MKQLENNNCNIFESIKHIDNNGCEYWEARKLQYALGYKEWRKFTNVINKAKIACNNSGNDAKEQFVYVDKLSKCNNNAIIEILDECSKKVIIWIYI